LLPCRGKKPARATVGLNVSALSKHLFGALASAAVSRRPGSSTSRAALVAAISALALLMPAPAEAAHTAVRAPLPSDRLHFGLAN
jgi:hypothetical protein